MQSGRTVGSPWTFKWRAKGCDSRGHCRIPTRHSHVHVLRWTIAAALGVCVIGSVLGGRFFRGGLYRRGDYGRSCVAFRGDLSSHAGGTTAGDLQLAADPWEPCGRTSERRAMIVVLSRMGAA